MVKSTPPPKVSNNRFWLIPYGYAGLLIVLTGLQLVGFGGFDFAGIELETEGEAGWILSLVFAEIFALPFLLRLTLSPLARQVSTLLSLVAPVLLFVLVGVGGVGMFGHAVDYIIAGVLLGLSTASFYILNGPQAMTLPKK